MADELQGLPFRAQLNALYASRRPRKIVCRLISVFGRLKRCDYYLGSSTVSRRHAVLWYDGSQMMLSDLASRGGTRVNCKTISTVTLQHKDEIQIGRYRLTFNIEHDGVPGEIIPAQIELTGLPAKRGPVVVGQPLVLCGSTPDLALTLRSKSVSSVHCVFVPTVWGVFVKDLYSRSGTLVNGKPVDLARLNGGDSVKIGRFTLSVRTIEPGSHRDQWPLVEESLSRLQQRIGKAKPKDLEDSDRLRLDEAIREPTINLPKKTGEGAEAEPAESSGLIPGQSSEVYDAPPDEIDLNSDEFDTGLDEEAD